MQNSFHYPGDDVMKQITEQCEQGTPRTLPLPAQEECIALRDLALNNSAFHSPSFSMPTPR